VERDAVEEVRFGHGRSSAGNAMGVAVGGVRVTDRL
jgi:hypothetical protein